MSDVLQPTEHWEADFTQQEFVRHSSPIYVLQNYLVLGSGLGHRPSMTNINMRSFLHKFSLLKHPVAPGPWLALETSTDQALVIYDDRLSLTSESESVNK